MSALGRHELAETGCVGCTTHRRLVRPQHPRSIPGPTDGACPCPDSSVARPPCPLSRRVVNTLTAKPQVTWVKVLTPPPERGVASLGRLRLLERNMAPRAVR